MNNEAVTMSTVIVAVIDMVVESVRKMAPISASDLGNIWLSYSYGDPAHNVRTIADTPTLRKQ